MAVAVAVDVTTLPNPIDVVQNSFLVDVTLTLTGAYGGAATHGDTVNLLGICPSDQVPKLVTLVEDPPAGTAPTGYLFYFCPGTNAANGVLCIFNPTNQTEYTEASNYSAGLLAAVLRATFKFPKYL